MSSGETILTGGLQVTTNSADGVYSYEEFYPVFQAMEEEGLVLNLHGECPSDASQNVTILNAESKFLPTLLDLHRRFPRLRIVLEHCTTEAAVDTVRECGDTVVGTITAHHLFITVEDWASDVVSAAVQLPRPPEVCPDWCGQFCYCKPVAKVI
jgi:dihydroorotase